jgi:hypothetical protein
MTLIQASLCSGDEIVILIADRLTTIELYGIEYEVEGTRSKLYPFGAHAIGFAGSSDEINAVLLKINKSKIPDRIEEFVEYISNSVKEVIQEQKASIIHRYTLKTLDEFKKDMFGDNGTIPNELKDNI